MRVAGAEGSDFHYPDELKPIQNQKSPPLPAHGSQRRPTAQAEAEKRVYDTAAPEPADTSLKVLSYYVLIMGAVFIDRKLNLRNRAVRSQTRAKIC